MARLGLSYSWVDLVCNIYKLRCINILFRKRVEMKKEIAIEIIKKLKKHYPDATCSLDFKTPFQMVVAVMLSAQCTDERVNKTTPSLFEKYGTPEAK